MQLRDERAELIAGIFTDPARQELWNNTIAVFHLKGLRRVSKLALRDFLFLV